MSEKKYDMNPEEENPSMLKDDSAVAYGTAATYGSEMSLQQLQDEIMQQPLEIKENLLVFLQNAIAAVKAKTKKKAKRETRYERELRMLSSFSGDWGEGMTVEEYCKSLRNTVPNREVPEW